MDDADLLASFARDKSQDAFQELARRHVGMVYSVCRRQLGDAHWAEDVTQAVFILLARKAESLPPTVILGGWLYKTAVFACSNARGLKRTRTYHENRVTPMKVQTEQEDLERAEMEGLLDQGLMELSKSQREVLVLRFFEKKPLAEVARMRHESLYLTQKTLDSALAKLRRFLSRRGVAAASAAIHATLLIEQSAHAVPAGLAATVGNAALSSSVGITSYAAQLASQILKQAGRAKLLAAVTAIAALLMLVLTGFAVGMSNRASANDPAHAAPAVAAAPGASSRDTLNPHDTEISASSRLLLPGAPQDIAADTAALWKTLARAEIALRTMDTPALNQVVAFTNPQQADNWALMSRVFAADQRLKQAAGTKFGPEGQTLTSIQTFAQRLDQILPLIDKTSLAWTVRSYDASLHFAFKDAQTQGGTLLFIKTDGTWKIDAGRSIDVALEGLGSNALRIAVEQLNPQERAGVVDHMNQMEQVLSTVAQRVESDPAYDLAAARTDLQQIDSAAGSRAFFHLALRLDAQELPRE